MIISIETPVFKGGWLINCIDSVLAQTSPNWKFFLLWDGGDELSKTIMEKLEEMDHPNIKVCFQERNGIAEARRFLTEHSEGEFILPLDDDDILDPNAIEEFIKAISNMPWSGIIRARRRFIDEHGKCFTTQDWFPFEKRQYSSGMTCDLFNHSQPYIFRRSAYEQTSGWEGFSEYQYAGEDCDIFSKIEEVAEIELLDKCLYSYRVHSKRASKDIGDAAAEDMWRRIADRTIKRRFLPLKRVNSKQPFNYIRTNRDTFSRDQIDIVIPFLETNEKEVFYQFSKPSNFFNVSTFLLNKKESYHQILKPVSAAFDRIKIACSSDGPISGVLKAALYLKKDSISPTAIAEYQIVNEHLFNKYIPLSFNEKSLNNEFFYRMEIIFYHDKKNQHNFYLQMLSEKEDSPNLMMKLFKKSPNCSQKWLERCLHSLIKSGIQKDSIHIIDKKQSSAANRNEGIKQTLKPIICFADDDIEIVSNNIFNVLLEKLNSHKSDLVGPKIIDDRENIFSADPYFDEALMPKPKGLGEIDTGQYNYCSIVPWLPSTFLLVKREVCNSLGGFDENYIGSQVEDVDFCLKAGSRGFKCLYNGNVMVKHLNCERNNNFSPNIQYFLKRWQTRRSLFGTNN